MPPLGPIPRTGFGREYVMRHLQFGGKHGARTAMSTRAVPSSLGLALDHFTVQRASRSFWASLFGCSAQPSGMRPSLSAAFSSSVLRCFGQGTIEASMIWPPMVRQPGLTQRRVKTGEQDLDGRTSLDRSAGESLAEGPNRVCVRHRVGQAQAQKAHKREPIFDEELGALVGAAVTGLEDKQLEHEDVIEGRAATFGP